MAILPEVECKGATIPYTSVNGHMFSALHKDGTVGLRLPAELRETFLSKYKTGLLEQYGVVQKEYVIVPDGLLRKTAELASYFKASFDYVSKLKPKPTTRKKKD